MSKKRHIINIIFILILLFIFIVPFSISSDRYHKFKTSPIDELPVIEVPVETVDISLLKENLGNTDIVGYIKINSISLESVVLQSKDNNYYLNHDINKNRSIYGVPFVDSRNKKDLSLEKQINIYGHNSSVESLYDNLPFSNLRHITNKDIFDNLSDIYLYTDNEVLIYEPYIVKVITTDYEYTRLKFVDDDILENHLNNLVSNTIYCKDPCNIPKDKNIIILQTCFYNPKGSYLLLIGIR